MTYETTRNFFVLHLKQTLKALCLREQKIWIFNISVKTCCLAKSVI